MFCLLIGAAAAQETIRVGSFYINGLGADAEREYERSLAGLAEILRELDADVVAIQGVRDTDLGRAQARRLTSMLNRAVTYSDDTATTYGVAISEQNIGGEATVFLWRAPVDLTAEPRPLLADNDGDGDGKATFRRMPQVAGFRAGGMDFMVVSVHVNTEPGETDAREGREAELGTLASWLKEMKSTTDSPKTIVMGNFNRHIEEAYVWGALQFEGHEAFYRLPLMEAIAGEAAGFDAVSDPAPDLRFNTSTNRNRRALWDTIVVSDGLYPSLPERPKWGMDAGVIAYDDDERRRWITSVWTTTTRTLSDHRPVWVELKLKATD